MAHELLWIVEMWEREKGKGVDVAAEKEEEAQITDEKELREHLVWKSIQRNSWWE